MSISVTNETGALQRIAIHRPGSEIELMLPENIEAFAEGPDGHIRENPDYLLFDDLVLLSRLREEHDQLTKVLRAACGDHEVFEVGSLFQEMFHEEPGRRGVVEEVLAAEEALWGENLEPCARDLLLDLGAEELSRSLIRGTLPSGERLLKWPSPNLLFARDIFAVVGQRVLLTYACKPGRSREMLLTRALFRHHPEFREIPTLDIASLVKKPSIEGGDVMVLGDGLVAIGVGERTDLESAQAAAQLLLATGTRRVYRVELGVSRSTMHLDTIFTLTGHGSCLVYAPLLLEPGAMRVVALEAKPDGTLSETLRHGSFLDILGEDGLELEAIPCGGEDAGSQAREQWSDGANAFALAPGKILLYARNEHTLRRLNAGGFEVLSPDEFCRNAALLLSDDERKVVVALEGFELSRGRGGPRCLTLPLLRRN